MLPRQVHLFLEWTNRRLRARIVNEAKASLLLDRFGQNVTLEKLSFAPSERNPKKILATCGAEDIAENADVARA